MSYTVGGTVSGLAGSGLRLQNNGADDITPLSDGDFVFRTALGDGAAYSVTVAAQPTGPDQTCTVVNGAGTINGGNVTNVTVSCTTDTYTVGGTVSGLAGAGLTLQNNGGNDLSIGADGSFTFTTPLTNGSGYGVTVAAQPSNPWQTCAVNNGAGTVSGANVTNVQVSCATNTYAVGGTVTGLAGSGLVLRNNGGDDLPVPANATSFVFASGVPSGASYAVTIASQPSNPSQTCAVSDATGDITNSAVSDIAITCTTNTYTIGGTVSGLAGTGLMLSNGTETLAISANGPFTFPAEIESGTAYTVTVTAQPTNLSQTCSVTQGGSGTVGGADISNVQVQCVTNSFTVGGTVRYLNGSGLVLQQNGGDDLAITANGSFTFATPVTDGQAYSVSVSTQPTSPAQTCTVTEAGSGTVAGANVVNVVVTCTLWTKQLATPGSDLTGGIATDASGNVYVAFATTGAFDGHSSSGGYDVAVIKYDANGAKAWSRQLGSAGNDYVSDIAVDGDGNVYLSGVTEGHLQGDNLGVSDAFVARLNADGTIGWIDQFGTAAYDAANGIAVDASGSIYVAGETDGELGDGVNEGDSDVFVARYTAAGVQSWVVQFGSSGYDAARGIAAGASGAVYVVGETDTTLGAATAGLTDFFLARFDDGGARQWIRQQGTPAYDAALRVAVDANGDVLIVGETDGGMNGYTNEGASDAFVAKYADDGTELWLSQFGTAAEDAPRAVATDASGNVYVAGLTEGALEGTAAGAADAFVARYDTNGTLNLTEQFGTGADDAAYGVATDASGNVYVAVDGEGGLDGYAPAGGEDVFVLKYNAAGVQQ